MDRNLNLCPRSTVVFAVALLAEGVDRNYLAQLIAETVSAVALLAEGVDRNPLPGHDPHRDDVALLAEGVDRNYFRP